MDHPIYHFTLLRHAESVGNAQSRWQGQSDYPLSEKGRAQARALAARWAAERVKFDIVIASPLLRARETVEIIASALALKVEIDPIWMERDVGEMEGLTADEILQKPKPPYVTPYEPIGGDGEGDWQLFLRAGKALHGLLRRPAGNYLVASHGGMLNQLMHAIVGAARHADPSGVRFHFENASFARVIYLPHQHRWLVDAVNDHAHLASLEEIGVRNLFDSSTGNRNGGH
ncbi:MAG: histidine phosphatase family protein [Verrucomicrobiota bacterium]|nr:histidine phosphatase family protein [Verrucomicrobiota bacterium]